MDLDQLQAMGFSEEQIQNALEITDGNVELALDLLLTGGTDDANYSDFQTQSLDQRICLKNVIQSEHSQYTFENGKSACTPIACQAAIEILNILKQATPFVPTPQIITDILFSGVQAYQEHLLTRGVEHSAVDEVLKNVPSFEKLRCPGGEMGGCLQGLTSNPSSFADVFQQAYSFQDIPPDSSIAVVITKPPETLLVVLPPRATENGTYHLFDSHSRPQFGIDGAYVYSSEDLSSLENLLQNIFPYHRSGRADDMMLMMYNSFDATVLFLGDQESQQQTPPNSVNPTQIDVDV